MNHYKPKPFTEDVKIKMEQAINEPLDDVRTLCNVIKLAYRCSNESSYNLSAAKLLLLEALWMGQRMHARLYEDQQLELKSESKHQEIEEDPFSVDWSNLDGRNVAQGNWD